MLPSSMRRVISGGPPSSLFSNFAPSNPRASAAASSFVLTSNPRCQQRRRYSSSKPSSPSDSPKNVPDGEVTATPASSTKQTGEKRKRKSNKDANADTNPHKLPSVPSTQHVPQKSMALSTFFSLHRPMSVTHSFPKTVSDDTFAQIFASRTKNNKANEVLSTLSSAVDQLEEPMRTLNLDPQQEAAATDSNGEQMRIEVRHADGSGSNVYVQLNAMSGQFLPFRPPPAPQPASTTSATSTAGAGVAQEEAAREAAAPATETRVYKAMFTLEETVDANGETRILAHSPQLLQEETGAGTSSADMVAPGGAPRTYLDRTATRQLQREQIRRKAPDMLAISVRRLRKLKMKKKKYKKLMKRTRNERRKLDRV